MSKNRRHARKRRFQRQNHNAPPGSIIIDPQARQPAIHLTAYDDEQTLDRQLKDVLEIRDHVGRWPVVWINVTGLGDAPTLELLGEMFGLHRLALEDVVNVHQRSKVESYHDHLFIVARMPRDGDHFDSEQVSMFLGKNFLLTFLEDPGDCFDRVRLRIREARGKIRNCGPDYLAYSLLDAVIDAYFPILEHLGERLDALEIDALSKHDSRIVAEIHAVKTDLLQLRRAIWPLRETCNALVRDESSLVHPETRVHLRDCYDHVVQMIDLIEVYRELGADLRDMYLTVVSNRMNEVMKVLTIITTVFMPLGLIAGIYGMNFHTEASPYNMPELKWYYGYPLALGLMLAVGLGMLGLFRRAGWLGSGDGALPVEPRANHKSSP